MAWQCQNIYLYLLLLFLSSKICLSFNLFGDDHEGEPSSIFNDLYNGIESFSNSVLQGIEYAAKTTPKVLAFAAFAAKFLDSNIDEECHYKCPSGEVAVPLPDHVQQYDGCGSLGFKIGKDSLFDPSMEECCNQHDICYDTCHSDKEICDKAFQKCLYRNCSAQGKIPSGTNAVSNTKCRASAKLLYTGTMTLGCMSYKEAQKSACMCVKKEHYQAGQYSTGGQNRFNKARHNGEL